MTQTGGMWVRGSSVEFVGKWQNEQLVRKAKWGEGSGEREWKNYQHWYKWWVRVSVAVHIEKKQQHKSVLKTPNNRKTTSEIAFPCRWMLCLCERTDKIFFFCFIVLFCFVFCAPSSHFSLSSLTFHLILLSLLRFCFSCFLLFSQSVETFHPLTFLLHCDIHFCVWAFLC